MWNLQQQQQQAPLTHSCLDILYSALKGQKLSRVGSTFLPVSLSAPLVVQRASHFLLFSQPPSSPLRFTGSGPGARRNANEVSLRNLPTSRSAPVVASSWSLNTPGARHPGTGGLHLGLHSTPGDTRTSPASTPARLS